MSIIQIETSPSPAAPLQLAVVCPAFTLLDSAGPQPDLGPHGRTHFVARTLLHDIELFILPTTSVRPNNTCSPDAAGPELIATARSFLGRGQEQPVQHRREREQIRRLDPSWKPRL
jgi:hypothetical protein